MKSFSAYALRLFVVPYLIYGLQQPVVAQSLEEQTVLTALTLNIIRLTKWPEKKGEGNDELNLCVVGDNVVLQSFFSVDGTTLNNKPLRIINLSRLLNMERCQVLYVSDLKQNLLQQVFLQLENKPILTIGDRHKFAESGGMVGLENVQGKISLLINLVAVQQSGLNISSRLLKLARIINVSNQRE